MTPSAPAAEEFRALGLHTFTLGEGRELVFAEPSGKSKLLSTMEVDLLVACTSFRTLEGHAREICRGAELPPDQVPPILFQLAQFARTGLLVTRRQVLDLVRGSGDAGPVPPPVSALGVVTRERPESLERCLESYIGNAKMHGRSCEFTVMDDAGTPDGCGRTRQILAGLKSRHGAALRHADRAEKDRFAEALAREAGVDPGLVAFALADPEGCGHTTGANRNALLLDTVGGLVVSVDDDTVCRPAGPPEPPAPGVALSSGSIGMDLWAFPDRAAALKAGAPLDADFLALHEKTLGKTLARIGREAEELSIDSIDARFLQRAGLGPAGVVLTQCGLAGDCASSASIWTLAATGATRNRLLASEASYRLGAATREVVRAAPRLTLTDRPSLMAYAFGLDNRALLPPFMPVHRNQDGVFAVALRQSLDTALLAQLPWTVDHLPLEQRSFSAKSTQALGRVGGVHEVINCCLASLEMGPAKPSGAPRMKALGKHLVDLASLDAAGFQECLRRLLWTRASSRVEELEQSLKEAGDSTPWLAADIRAAIDSILVALTEPDFGVARDLLPGRDFEAARALTQRLVLRFGKLLEAWPDLVEAAKRLRAREVRVSAPVE